MVAAVRPVTLASVPPIVSEASVEVIDAGGVHRHVGQGGGAGAGLGGVERGLQGQRSRRRASAAPSAVTMPTPLIVSAPAAMPVAKAVALAAGSVCVYVVVLGVVSVPRPASCALAIEASEIVSPDVGADLEALRGERAVEQLRCR